MREWTLGIVLFPLVLGCVEEPELVDEPSPCVGGQYCLGTLVCIGGFCVQPDDTGDISDENESDESSDMGDGDDPSESTTGDGDGETTTDADTETTTDDDGAGCEGCPCLAGECDANSSCIDEVCVPGECGDGVVNPGEGCDDGNGIDDDACTNDCSLASCGDGRVQVGEICDDGDDDDSDACLSTCVMASCGDGHVQAGVEECDDQNADNDDACVETCMEPFCGDGFLQGNMGEECDDQNLDNDDECLETCTLPYCGDGFVQLSAGESCDDGNAVIHDGCEPECVHTPVLQVVSGWAQTCVLSVDHTVRCWGRNTYGELGHGNTEDFGDEPGEMPPPITNVGPDPIDIAAGDRHNCALFEGGQLRCWGRNAFGQLGYGHTNDLGDNPGEMPTPVVDVGGPVQQVALGRHHTCALLESGVVRCWGGNAFGQLGYGTVYEVGNAPGEMPPANVDIGGVVTQIAAGAEHNCALLDTGKVRCWGNGGVGQLGYGNGQSKGDQPGEMPPPDVPLGNNPATAIEAGTTMSCKRVGATLSCWGASGFGALGQGYVDYIGDQPGEMPPPSVPCGGVSDVAMSVNLCGVSIDGLLRCWGYGSYGNNGLGNTLHIGDMPGEMPPPYVDVGGTVSLLHQTSGSGMHCVVLEEDNTLRCWGWGESGALGTGNTDNVGDQPGEMPPVPVQLF